MARPCNRPQQITPKTQIPGRRRSLSADSVLLSQRPGPVPDLRPVDALRVRIVNAVDDLTLEPLFQVRSGRLDARHSIDHIDREMEAIDVVAYRQLQRRVDVATLHVSANVNVRMVGATIGELVDQPGIAVEVEDDRLVLGEERIEIAIADSVRMLRLRLQPIKID